MLRTRLASPWFLLVCAISFTRAVTFRVERASYSVGTV